jgi:hypothetical protein
VGVGVGVTGELRQEEVYSAITVASRVFPGQ